MRLCPRLVACSLALTSFALASAVSLAAPPASDPTPEIVRKPGAPQKIGAVHTLRQIPEACARMEGKFTGQSANPYAMSLVRTSANCQPRAQFVDAAKVKPSVAGGWKLNDRIQVPNADCPSQQTVLRVWRKPASAMPPKLDAQGRSRIYLEQMKQAAAAGKLNPVPLYAAELAVDGKGCG